MSPLLTFYWSKARALKNYTKILTHSTGPEAASYKNVIIFLGEYLENIDHVDKISSSLGKKYSYFLCGRKIEKRYVSTFAPL